MRRTCARVCDPYFFFFFLGGAIGAS
jgi:hypothetical protein